MKKTLQYQTIQEREQLLSENTELILIEEQNITEGNFLIFSDNPNVDSKQIVYTNVPQEDFSKLQNQLKTADDKYKELDLTTALLQDVKDAKMAQLNELCGIAIENGFDYTVNNIDYHFSCSLSAQANFQGADTLFKDGAITEAEWTVINNSNGKTERIILDQATFNSIKLQVFNHINLNVTRLRNVLQPQVESATTNSAVDVVVW